MIGSYEKENVIFVRCNVGDFVFALWPVSLACNYIVYCAEVKEIRVKKTLGMERISYILEPIEYRGRRKEYFEEDFGNLVFFSEDEAERKVEEFK